MKTLIASLTLLALLLPAPDAPADDSQEEPWEFGEFVHETYLFPIAWDAVRKSVPEGLGQRKWEVRTDLARRHMEKLRKDQTLMVKLYGYAVGNQLARSPEGSTALMLARRIEKDLAARIPLLARRACEGDNPNPTAADIEKWERSLTRLMEQAVQGEFDPDLKRLTEVDPAKAPDFFLFRCRRIVTRGNLQWWEWPNDARWEGGTVVDVWKLSLPEGGGDGDAECVSRRQANRKWRLVDCLFLFWLAPDGGAEVVFLLHEDGAAGVPLSTSEKEEFARDGRLSAWPTGDDRITVRLQLAMDPDAVLGEWAVGRTSGEMLKGENRLLIRIDAVPGRPGHYVGRITEMGSAYREAYPGGEEMEIVRLVYREERSAWERILYFDIREYSALAAKHGGELWPEKPMIRFIGNKLNGLYTRCWLRR